MLFVLNSDASSDYILKEKLFHITGSDRINGLHRRECAPKTKACVKAYRLSLGEIYEKQCKYFDWTGYCVHEESRYFAYELQGLREILEEELLGLLDEMEAKSA